MATFAYKVMDAKGTPATGQVDGDSKVVAAAALRSRGLTVLDLDEVKRGLGQIDILEPFQTIKARYLTVFSRQFATMVNSGLSMLRCLYVLEEQTPNKKLCKVIADLKDDVEAGISLPGEMDLPELKEGIDSARSGNWKKAAVCFQAGVENYPKQKDLYKAYYNLVMAYECIIEYEKAMTAFSLANELHQDARFQSEIEYCERSSRCLEWREKGKR